MRNEFVIVPGNKMSIDIFINYRKHVQDKGLRRIIEIFGSISGN